VKWHARHGVIAVGFWVIAGSGGARVTGIASRMRSADVGRGFCDGAAAPSVRCLRVYVGAVGVGLFFWYCDVLGGLVWGVGLRFFFPFLDLAWLIFLFLASHLCVLAVKAPAFWGSCAR